MPIILDKDSLSLRLEHHIDAYPEGIIIPVNKPYRWTSADVIRKIKFAACKYFGKRNLKVGHAGTLDPLATGVLLVCIGKATKLAEELQKHDKEYIADISFGATTPSFDLEKAIDAKYPTDRISEEAIKAILPNFLGKQEQIAPIFSAKSIDGIRAYELARKQYKKSTQDGSEFDHSAAELLNKQIINITDLELLAFYPTGLNKKTTELDTKGINSRINVEDNSELHLPMAQIRIACSKGTYIRALARDLGEALHSGAYLEGLQRTKTGSFYIENALSMDEAINQLHI